MTEQEITEAWQAIQVAASSAWQAIVTEVGTPQLMTKPETESASGTTVANYVPSPYFGSILVNKPPRASFSCQNNRVYLEGTCETKQDLRDVLRELLAALEAD